MRNKIKEFCNDIGSNRLNKYTLPAILMAFYSEARINWFKDESIEEVKKILNLSDMEIKYWSQTLLEIKKEVIL